MPARVRDGALTQRARGARWIPAGGSTPLGVLGHVNAALELAEQIDARRVPSAEHVVVPLGTGGTAAGLALGVRDRRTRHRVVGVRVVPRDRRRARSASCGSRNATARSSSACGERVPRIDPERLVHR